MTVGVPGQPPTSLRTCTHSHGQILMPYDTLQGSMRDSLRAKTEEALREVESGLRSLQFLDRCQLDQLWHALSCNKSDAGPKDYGDEEERWVNYEGFCKAATLCREELGFAVHPFFSASNFLRCAPDHLGRISCVDFFNYVMQRDAILRLRVDLCKASADGKVLTLAELEGFIENLMPKLPGLLLETHIELDPVLYSRTVAAKLMFFYGSRNRVRISDILDSDLLLELLELRHPGVQMDDVSQSSFSKAGIYRLVRSFEHFSDGGWMDAAGLSEFCGGRMTPLFLDRLFEERSAKCTPSYNSGQKGCDAQNRMDYAAFLRFVFAWEHRDEPAALHYFFPLFDLGGKGCITQEDLYMFVKEVYAMWCASGQPQDLMMEDIISELIAMTNPKRVDQITLKDVLKSSMGGVFVGILANVQVFWMYENRENVSSQ